MNQGVALGNETARIAMTMSTKDLDVLGFDSEGVTVSVRADEVGQTSVARFIQIDMLLLGSTYFGAGRSGLCGQLEQRFGNDFGAQPEVKSFERMKKKRE